MLFATKGDVERFTGQPVDPEVDLPVMLRRASAMVQHAVRYARFDVTPSGAPADPDVVEALRDATCAQVECWVASGIVQPSQVDTTAAVSRTALDGASLDYDVDGARQTRATLAAALCDEATWILDNAGLTGGGAVWAR